MEEFVGVNFKIGGEDSLAQAMNNVARATAQMVSTIEKLHSRLGRTVRDEAKKTEATHLSAEQAKRRATEQAARDDNKLLVKLARDEIKTLSDRVRAHEKAEKDKTAQTKREASERQRAEEKAAREAAAAKRREDREVEASIRRAGVTIARAEREAASAAKRGEKERLEAVNGRREYLRAGASGAVGGARGAFGSLASAAAIGGGGALAYGLAAAKDEADLQKKAAGIAIATREGDQSLDAREMVRVAQKIAGEQGTAPAEVLDAVMAAAEHGEGRIGADTFLKNIGVFSKLGLATGTDLKDLAENSAALTSSGITDPQVQRSVMLRIAGASKQGNIGLREMGMNLASAYAATGGFEGDAASRAVHASALMQMARSGVGGSKSSEDAATAVRNFYNDVSSKHGSELLEDLGVKTMGVGGQRRDAFEVYLDALDKAKGDPTKLTGILGMQSRAVGQAMSSAYDKDGRAGVRAMLSKYEGANMTTAEVESDADRMRNDASTRFAAELEKLKAAVGSKMLPLLVEYMPKLSDAIEKVVKAVGDPENVKRFQDGLAMAVKVLELFIKHPVMTGAAFVGLKTVMGGIEGLASAWLSKNLFAPVTTVNAGVVNVVGKAPGGGGLPDIARNLAKDGAGPMSLAARVVPGAGLLGLAAPIAAGALTGWAVGQGLSSVNEHLLASSPGYKKFWDESGWVNDPNSGFAPGKSYEAAPAVGRDKLGRIMTMASVERDRVAAGLGLGGNGPTSAPSLAGSSLSVPGLAPVELAPDTKVGLDRQSAEAIGEAVVSGLKRARDDKASTSIVERMLK